MRGPAHLTPIVARPEVRAVVTKDPWTRALLIAAGALVVLVILAFGGFNLALGSGVAHVQSSTFSAP